MESIESTGVGLMNKKKIKRKEVAITLISVNPMSAVKVIPEPTSEDVEVEGEAVPVVEPTEKTQQTSELKHTPIILNRFSIITMKLIKKNGLSATLLIMLQSMSR